MDIKPLQKNQTVVIRSVRNDGSKFRPSDWIERLAATLSSFGSSQQKGYQQAAKPCMIDGEKCLVVDGKLAELNPAAYEFIMNFVYSNDLSFQQDRRQRDQFVNKDRRSR